MVYSKLLYTAHLGISYNFLVMPILPPKVTKENVK